MSQGMSNGDKMQKSDGMKKDAMKSDAMKKDGMQKDGMAGGATAGPIGRDVLLEVMKRDPSRRVDRFKKMASR